MNSATDAGLDEDRFRRIKQFIIVMVVVNLLGVGGFALLVLT
ncbi:hypothetical protein [Halovenus carboxidivorans]|nr:hypothetical protein [Halovenus carboxidivorans]